MNMVSDNLTQQQYPHQCSTPMSTRVGTIPKAKLFQETSQLPCVENSPKLQSQNDYLVQDWPEYQGSPPTQSQLNGNPPVFNHMQNAANTQQMRVNEQVPVKNKQDIYNYNQPQTEYTRNAAAPAVSQAQQVSGSARESQNQPPVYQSQQASGGRGDALSADTPEQSSNYLLTNSQNRVKDVG